MVSEAKMSARSFISYGFARNLKRLWVWLFLKIHDIVAIDEE